MANAPLLDFMSRLKKMEDNKVTIRETFILWVVAREYGCMGTDVSRKLGYATRTAVQLPILRLLRDGLIEDRRPKDTDPRVTPNELYITAKGAAILADIVPLYHDPL